MTDLDCPKHRGRFLLGTTAFLHYSTLGCVLPFLPLYLTRTVGLTWTQAGLVSGALPLGGLLAPPLMRGLSRVGVDARMGLSISHLLAAGIVMSSEVFRQNSAVPQGRWGIAFCATFAYAVMLSPSLGWMLEMARLLTPPARADVATKTSEDSVSEPVGTWRLWGAVGFLAPAWLIESLLARHADIHDSLANLGLLPEIAGWSGSLTALAALISATTFGPQCGPKSQATNNGDKATTFPIPARMALLIVLLAGGSRLHGFWTAPFFAGTFERLGIVQPLLYRITVVGQIFEILALIALPAGLKLAGPRALALAGSSLWLLRSLILAWTSQAGVVPRDALLAMCLGQTLSGIAVVWCFGALAVSIGSQGITRTAPIAGLSSWVFLAGAGWSTDWLLNAPARPIALTSIVAGILPGFTVQGWSMVWLATTLPVLASAVLLMLGRLELPGAGASDKTP